ncbi:DUF262 domain-containing protein [Qipengyuania sp. NPDC077410]|uniref:DUF262 domain-containing protein n=1 Tax=Qipengyuania sp. NPDC077410 TaxID=3364496 RepID=UPI0037CAAE38
MLEQFRISDFLEWHEAKTLLINKDFQRGSVWKPAAKIMLIDTILRDLPVPKIYIRSIIDRDTRKSKREIVDGQQRLRAIIDFAQDKITLSSRTKEYAGKKFSTLSDEDKDQFLQYPLSVDQLVNADDQKVLEIFARLNSYSVKLNDPELRHAEFQGDFKWSVHELANSLHNFWVDSGLFSPATMVRMSHTSLLAEMYGVVLNGIQDGGQPKVRALYRQYDKSDNFEREDVEGQIKRALDWISENILEDIEGTVLLRPAHFLMLFAAVTHCLDGIPKGALNDDEFDEHAKIGDANAIREALTELAATVELDEEPDERSDFWNASSSSLQRISSRRVRFPYFVEALSSEE